MTSTYEGWTRPRWSGRVLIATNPSGVERSIGEVYGPERGPGVKKGILVHPGSGEERWVEPFQTAAAARAWVGRTFLQLGGGAEPQPSTVSADTVEPHQGAGATPAADRGAATLPDPEDHGGAITTGAGDAPSGIGRAPTLLVALDDLARLADHLVPETRRESLRSVIRIAFELGRGAR